METVELNVDVREVNKRADLNNLRRDGGFPAVIYAEGKASTSLKVDEHHYSVQTAGKSATQIYLLKSDEKELDGKMALIKSVQKEPIKQKVQHVDFYLVTAGTKISVVVAIRLVGECAPVKSGVAILNQTSYEVEVECLPREIPEFFEVDVSKLDEGDSIHLGDIELPEGVSFKSDTGINVVSVLAKRIEVEEEPEEAVAAEGAEGAEGAAPADGAAPAAAADGAAAGDDKAKS